MTPGAAQTRNAYVVTIPETREYVEPLLDDGTGPIESWQPIGIYVAETAAQAKRDALHDWSHGSRTGVESDDWPALRVRLIEKNVALERGCADSVDSLWNVVAGLAL